MSSSSLRSKSKHYLRGTTYLRTPFFGMIAVVTLFVIRAGALCVYVTKFSATDLIVVSAMQFS